ncbi:MAG: uroporphyrinogen decarboxylase family protein, partial [Pseudomonadota bacterium]
EVLKAKYPETPILGFPRAANALTARFVRETGVDGVSCDTSMPVEVMVELAKSEDVVVQGNLDPLLLVAGGEALDARVRQIVGAMKGQRFIFNLGHGIVPQTPPENVARLVQVVREG